MASFASATFDELGPDSTYAVWQKDSNFVVKKIPGSADNVIQKIALARARLDMPIKATASQITALYGKVGDSGTLAFTYESVSATLEAMDSPLSIGIDNNLYTSVLHFLKT